MTRNKLTVVFGFATLGVLLALGACASPPGASTSKRLTVQLPEPHPKEHATEWRRQPAAPRRSAPPVQVGQLVRVRGLPHLVLQQEPPAHAYGPMVFAHDSDEDGEAVVIRKLSPTAEVPVLPVGHRLRLFGGANTLCFARVQSVRIVGRVEPGPEGFDAESGKLSMAERAERLWPHTDGGRMVLARLSMESSGCENSEWARSASLDEPAMQAASQPSPKMLYGGLQALQKTDVHREIQQRYIDERPSRSGQLWYQHAADSIRARVVKPMERGGSAYLWLAADVGEGCDDFGAHVVALWRLLPEGQMQLMFAEEQNQFIDAPTVAIQQDTADDVDLLAPLAWLRPVGRDYTYQLAQLTFYGCTC